MPRTPPSRIRPVAHGANPSAFGWPLKQRASSLAIGCSICLCITGVALGQTYTFTTISGIPGQAGSDDGTNHSALFSGPAGLALDKGGNLYVAEEGNHTIRKLTAVGTNWVVSTIAGLAGTSGSIDATNSDARFNRPRGLAVDALGTVFVADTFNSVVRKIVPEGTNWVVSTIAGSVGVLDFADGLGENALFRRLTGITASPGGNLFIADMNNHVIRQATPAGAQWDVATLVGFPFLAGGVDGIGTDAEFSGPYSLVAAGDDTVYVADTGNNGIRRVQLTESGWDATTIAGTLNSPAGSEDGVGSEAQFNFPIGIARDDSGTLFVTDQQNHTLRIISPVQTAWRVGTIAGSPRQSGTNDGVGMDARFERPWGIAVNQFGTLFVADLRNHTIRMGTPSPSVAGPELTVQRGTDGLVLSWPLSAGDYALETSASLGNQTDWSEITEGITATGDAYQAARPFGGTAAFFRLRKR